MIKISHLLHGIRSKLTNEVNKIVPCHRVIDSTYLLASCIERSATCGVPLSLLLTSLLSISSFLSINSSVLQCSVVVQDVSVSYHINFVNASCRVSSPGRSLDLGGKWRLECLLCRAKGPNLIFTRSHHGFQIVQASRLVWQAPSSASRSGGRLRWTGAVHCRRRRIAPPML